MNVVLSPFDGGNVQQKRVILLTQWHGMKNKEFNALNAQHQPAKHLISRILSSSPTFPLIHDLWIAAYVCLYFSHVFFPLNLLLFSFFCSMEHAMLHDTWHNIKHYFMNVCNPPFAYYSFALVSAPFSRRYFPFAPIIFHLLSFKKHSVVER